MRRDYSGISKLACLLQAEMTKSEGSRIFLFSSEILTMKVGLLHAALAVCRPFLTSEMSKQVGGLELEIGKCMAGSKCEAATLTSRMKEADSVWSALTANPKTTAFGLFFQLMEQ